MKRLLVFSLVSGLLLAQTESAKNVGLDPDSVLSELRYEIFSLVAKSDSEQADVSRGIFLDNLLQFVKDVLSALSPRREDQASPPTTSVNLPYSPVDSVVAPFYGYYSAEPAIYSPLFRPRSGEGFHAGLTTVQPAPSQDPQMIFLDGFTNVLVAFDLTTQTTVSSVVVPSTVGPFGIRPSATGASNEVWVANGGSGVSVADLRAQSVVATIATPSIPQAVSIATPGIGFTNDGTKAFEAVRYDSADSAGNNGALLVIDAVNRVVTSTLLLKNGPSALLMAPDGLTAYILSSSGTITYYDVLSGTADLTVSTYTPGSNGGYPGAGSAVAIHPDGTRIFWNAGVYLAVFNLTTRSVTNMFNSGLPTTVGRTFSLSQDGGRAYFSDPQGDVAVVDTLNGVILDSYNTGAATSIFGGPLIAP